MNKDFRIAVTLADHPKAEKLERRCGGGAFRCLIRLFGFVAMNKPSGVLTRMDSEDIEIAAGWRGEPGAFVAALQDVRFLDFDGECFSVHDWEEHNGYAAHAEARSERASRAARARYEKDASTAQYYHEHALSTATSNTEHCPSPSPTPTPTPKDKESPPDSCSSQGVLSAQPEKQPQEQADFAAFWAAYPRKVGKGAALKAWASTKKARPPLMQIVSAIHAQCKGEGWTKEGGKFIPHPATWLNAHRWADEVQAKAEEDYPWKARVAELDRIEREKAARGLG